MIQRPQRPYPKTMKEEITSQEATTYQPKQRDTTNPSWTKSHLQP
jgi:hypothetical protein